MGLLYLTLESQQIWQWPYVYELVSNWGISGSSDPQAVCSPRIWARRERDTQGFREQALEHDSHCCTCLDFALGSDCPLLPQFTWEERCRGECSHIHWYVGLLLIVLRGWCSAGDQTWPPGGCVKPNSIPLSSGTQPSGRLLFFKSSGESSWPSVEFLCTFTTFSMLQELLPVYNEKSFCKIKIALIYYWYYLTPGSEFLLAKWLLPVLTSSLGKDIHRLGSLFCTQYL